jgi:CrcB protein
MLNCLYVGIGGFIGSILRYLIGLIPVGEKTSFPIKTLLINVAGAFFIGVIVSLASKGNTLDRRMVLFLKVGICGGFTTFSTFAYETEDLIAGSQAGVGITYVLASIIMGTLAVYAGMTLCK